MKLFKIATALLFVGSLATVTFAGPNWPKHPNLVAAWSDLDAAWAKVDKAQDANGDALGGHGAKAKAFIQTAQDELKAARDSANKNKGEGTGGDATDCPKAFDFPKHPNMAAASASLSKACVKITAAQKANEFDMDGHAAKAKAAVISAMGEMLEARNFANNK